MIAMEAQHVLVAAAVVPMAARPAGVLRCDMFLTLLPDVRLAVPDPAPEVRNRSVGPAWSRCPRPRDACADGPPQSARPAFYQPPCVQ